MFSKTDNAAQVRKEVITVYMAYRHGQSTGVETKKLPDIHIPFDDYNALLTALISGMKAMEQIGTIKQHQVFRENNAHVIGALIDETDLSDEEIAEKMCPVTGGYIPERVAYHRRKRHKLN